MRTLLALLIAAVPLAGCVAVPIEPAPMVYAPAPPVVVVRPLPYYGHHHYHGGGRYSRRWR